MIRVKKAVLPAAGFGTRFLPATKAIPKELLPIVDKPTIQYIMEEVVAAGIEEVVLITGREKGSIEDHFDTSVELENHLKKKGRKDLLEMVQDISEMVTLVSVRQKEPLGLGHAVLCAKKVVGNEPFAVLLGDDLIDAKIPCIKQMAQERLHGGWSRFVPVGEEEALEFLYQCWIFLPWLYMFWLEQREHRAGFQ
jgi:UTP--glucose-1-phosphate uridylyltransferase